LFFVDITAVPKFFIHVAPVGFYFFINEIPIEVFFAKTNHEAPKETRSDVLPSNHTELPRNTSLWRNIVLRKIVPNLLCFIAGVSFGRRQGQASCCRTMAPLNHGRYQSAQAATSARTVVTRLD
jgi:hypothetical protein